MARFTTDHDAKAEIVTAIGAYAYNYDIDAIFRDAYIWKVDHDADGNELLNTGGFECVDSFWQIVAKHEKRSDDSA